MYNILQFNFVHYAVFEMLAKKNDRKLITRAWVCVSCYHLGQQCKCRLCCDYNGSQQVVNTTILQLHYRYLFGSF